jgi:small-conductance mechanosensitive channel
VLLAQLVAWVGGRITARIDARGHRGGRPLGVALGSGGQRVVQDLLGGFFLIAERQYGFGDVIRVAPPGSTTGVTGNVEVLSLRMTRLRTANGEVLFLANGEIRQVTNRSRDWARAVIDVRTRRRARGQEDARRQPAGPATPHLR